MEDEKKYLKIMGEHFVLNIFEKLYAQLPKFKSNLDHYYEERQMATVDDRAKKLIGDLLRCQVFYPL